MNQSPRRVSIRSSPVLELRLTSKSSLDVPAINSDTDSNSTPIISLSKLKNYMPKNPETSSSRAIDNLRRRQEADYSNTQATKKHCSGSRIEGPQNEQTRNSKNFDRFAFAHTNNSSLNLRESPNIEEPNNFQSNSSDHQQARIAALNQVCSVQTAQQESKYLHRQYNSGRIASAIAVESNRSLCSAPSSKGVKEAGPAIGTHSSSKQRQQRHQLQQRQPQLDQAFFLSDERKRKRTDNLSTLGNSCSSGSGTLLASEIDRGKRLSCGYGENNMTPSALLLQSQSLECVDRPFPEQQSQEQEFQQQQQEYNLNLIATDKDHCRQPIHTDCSTKLSKISLQDKRELLNSDDNLANEHAHNSSQRMNSTITTSTEAIEISTTSSQLDQQSSFTPESSHQSRSKDNVNQASTSNDSNSNTISNNRNNTQPKLSIPSKYLAKDLHPIQKEIYQGNNLHNNNNNISRSNRAIHFDKQHFGAQANATEVPLTQQYYQSNFSTPMLAGQQFKLDNSYMERLNNNSDNTKDFTNPFERQTVHLNQTGASSSSTVAREVASHYQQTKSNSINQYYNNYYNLIPTSKSSSPNSSSSSPSPKATNMQALNAGHNTTNQLISSGLNHSTSAAMAAAESHLDNLNNHYINCNATNLGLNHQHHHQLNQHYSYNPQATTHHLSMSGHEQSYSHAQQQQQQQQAQQHTQNNSTTSQQQSIYHQIANSGGGGGGGGGGHTYGTTNNNAVHYHNQLQSAGNQANNLMADAHQNHLNNAAAACAAAAVVSQTLKTVANQHNNHPHNHYGGSAPNNFGTSAGLMNMTTQHHQQFHNTLGQHHLSHNQGGGIHSNQHQMHHHHQQVVHQVASVVTRKYQCKMCPQVFMSKAEMKYHNQNHMREAKPYKCLQCPKAFANSSYLSQHMRIHQGLKPYTCDICTRKFTQLSHLQQHKRTHTGDKPYKCNYMNCTKQFSQLSNLQSHSRCHQLDKPYKCNSCYKCFHDEPSLLEHIPRHLESKHLKKNLCIFCGSSYQQERGLVKHFQQYHTDKTPTLVAAAIAAGTTGNTGLIASLISSTQSGVFVTPSSGSTSSTSSSLGSGSGSLSSATSLTGSNPLNGHNNNNNIANNGNIDHGFTTNKCDGIQLER